MPELVRPLQSFCKLFSRVAPRVTKLACHGTTFLNDIEAYRAECPVDSGFLSVGALPAGVPGFIAAWMPVNCGQQKTF